MDYKKLGNEYLEEAQKIKEHLVPIKEEIKHASGHNTVALFRRAAMLNQMYLECLHTGRYLKSQGGDADAKNKTAKL